MRYNEIGLQPNPAAFAQNWVW